MSKFHYVRWRGRALVACNNKMDFFKVDRKNGFFDCKRCLKVVTSKNWRMMINGGVAEKYYREVINN